MPGIKQRSCWCMQKFGKNSLPASKLSDKWYGHCVRCGGKI